MQLAITLHLLSAIVWVGGMFFAHGVLRPIAATVLEPPQRLSLWAGVFSRFFPWVWAATLILPITGIWMIVLFGGFASVGMHVHIMLLLGAVMITVFMNMFYGPYKKFKAFVAQQDWPAAGTELVKIRKRVGLNLILGILTASIAGLGRYSW